MPKTHPDTLLAKGPCHVGIHWIALAEHSQVSTHVPGFQSFFSFLYHFVLAKLTTSSMRVNKGKSSGYNAKSEQVNTTRLVSLGVACYCFSPL